MAVAVKDMSTADLCCLLEEAGVHEKILLRIESTGWTEEDLKELIPMIGTGSV